MGNIETVAETKDYVLIYKPAGMPVESKCITVTDLFHALKVRYGELFIINRLDQPVEGLVLLAKNKKSAAALSDQMTKGIIKKDYVCIVCGKPAGEKGHLEDWLCRRKDANASEVVCAGTKGAKKAELDYELYETVRLDGKEYSLLGIRLLTGRHHQIRVQLSHMGVPIAGDRKYGGGNAVPRNNGDETPAREKNAETHAPESEGAMNCVLKQPGAAEDRFPALCAYRIAFQDPQNRKTVIYSRKPEGALFRAFKEDYLQP